EARDRRQRETRAVSGTEKKFLVIGQEMIGKGLQRDELVRAAIHIGVPRPIGLYNDDIELVLALAQYDIPGSRIGKLIHAAQENGRHEPPSFKIYFHSSDVTGCTERREYFTSTMSLSLGSALISASVTGRARSLTALTSTRPKRPVSSVGSLRYSPITSTMPTIRRSSPVW